MIFLNPFAFFLFFLPILLFVLRKLRIFSKPALSLSFADWQGNSFEFESLFFKIISALSSFLFFAAFSALIFAFAEPVVRKTEKVYTSRGTEILFVLDTSISMAARDMTFMNTQISRLDAAKRAIRTLVESNSSLNFALVAVASEAALVVPPTNDSEVFLERLDSLNVGELGDGSALGTGISSAVYHLVSSKSPRKAIVLLTDGENNSGLVSPQTAAELALERKISLYVLGIGTNGTIPLEYVDSSGKKRSVLYESSFDSEPLRKIADASHGKYFSVDSFAELGEFLFQIASKEKIERAFVNRTADREFYGEFLIASGILFTFSAILRRLFLKEIL